jgi:hypothetical protein
MNTASTCGDRHSFSAESKAKGISWRRADSCAFTRSRRDRAVTRQFLARAKPGMSRFPAWSPKPMIPKLIMCRAYFETDIEAGETLVDVDCEVLVKAPVVASIDRAVIVLAS